MVDHDGPSLDAFLEAAEEQRLARLDELGTQTLPQRSGLHGDPSPSLLVEIGEVHESGLAVVQADEGASVCSKDFGDLVSHEVDDFLEIELLGQALLDAIDDGQLGLALFQTLLRGPFPDHLGLGLHFLGGCLRTRLCRHVGFLCESVNQLSCRCARALGVGEGKPRIVTDHELVHVSLNRRLTCAMLA